MTMAEIGRSANYFFRPFVEMWHAVSDGGANGVVHYRLVGLSFLAVVVELGSKISSNLDSKV